MKYIGSKSKLINKIKPIIESYITDDTVAYLEPMVGGANSIVEIDCKKRIGIDINPLVISLLKKAKTDLEWFETLPELPTKEHYIDVVKYPEKYSLEYRAAILCFGSYNNRSNGGYYGACATSKTGKFRNYFDEAKRNLIKQSTKLKNIEFHCSDYKKLPIENIKNFVIYCDPPYRKSYYKDKVYSKDGFDYEVYYKWCIDMSKDNVVLMSEYNMPEEFECIWEIETKTSMDKQNNQQKRIEKIFKVK